MSQEEFPIKRSFIEETFPVREVSEESAREKNISNGHITTLHLRWARRPLVASSTTDYADLIPASERIEAAVMLNNSITQL